MQNEHSVLFKIDACMYRETSEITFENILQPTLNRTKELCTKKLYKEPH